MPDENINKYDFFPNFVLYWKDHRFSKSRFDIEKSGKIVDLKMNFKNLF